MRIAKYKKTLNFTLSSSTPYSYEDNYDTPGEQVDLTNKNIFSASYVDMMKVGYNAATSRQEGDYQTGFAKEYLYKYTQQYIDGYPEPEQYGYGISFINLNGPNSGGPNGFVSSIDRLSLDDVFGPNAKQALFRSSLSPIVGRGCTLTGQFRSKIDFGICPPPGPSGAGTRFRLLNYPSWWADGDEWKKFVVDNFNDKMFYDLYFKIETPYLLEQISKNASSAHTRETYVDIKPSYNFYVREYEEGVKEYDESSVSPFPSYALPNIYMFISELSDSYLDPTTPGSAGVPTQFYKHITLNDNIKGTFQDILRTMSNGGVKKIGEADEGQHFQKFGNLLKYKKSRVLDALVELDNYKNLAFPNNNLDLLQEHRGKEILFPMSIDLEFTTDINTVVGDLIRDTNLASSLIRYVTTSGEEMEVESQYSFPDWCTYDDSGVCQPSPARIGQESLYKKNRVWDFTTWLEGERVTEQATFSGDSVNTPEDIIPARIQQINRYLERLKEVTRSLELGPYTEREIYYFENVLSTGELILSVPPGEKITVEVIERKGRELKQERGLLEQALATPGAPIPAPTPPQDYAGLVFLGKTNEEVLISDAARSDPQYALYSQIMRLLARTRFNELVGENFRHYTDLLKNNLNTVQGGKLPAYSETILYCVEKIAGEEFKEDVNWTSEVQYIWFPNSSDVDIINYIDTQVKYDVPYRYIIKAYQLVVGNEYRYKINDGQSIGGRTYGQTDDDLWASICLFNTPCLKIVEVPFYDTNWDNIRGVKVTDASPMPPDVEIIPYKGISDKILIWLNGNVGEGWFPDIQILPNELDRDGMIRNEKSEIYFKSDDPAIRFEIFRLNKPPKQYRDFAEGKRINLGTPTLPENSFVDDLEPNVKYYYTFRSIDVHGKVSNPSPVYECELVTEREFTYPYIRIYDMQSRKTEATKPFKRFLEIGASTNQTTLNTAPLKSLANLLEKGRVTGPVTDDILNDIAKNIQFINPGQSLWNSTGENKKYKIRINSKKSCRKIDLNIDFNNSGIVSNETDQD